MDGLGVDPTVVVVAGLLTVNAPFSVAVPPPGVALVTETLWTPTVAFAGIVILAVIAVWLFTTVLLTVMSDPKLTELTPLMKLVPVKVTSSVCVRFPLVGEILANVGAGLLIVNDALVAPVKPALLADSV